MKKVIIIAGVVLLFLIIIFAVISRTLSQRGGGQTNITPIPLQDLSGSSRDQSGTGTGTDQASEGSQTSGVDHDKNVRSPNARDLAALQNLKQKLPIDNDDFAIDVATAEGEIDRFAVVRKSTTGHQKIRKFLSDNKLGGIDYQNLKKTEDNPFIYVDETTDELDDDEFEEQTEAETGSESQPGKKSSRQLKKLMDIFFKIDDFNVNRIPTDQGQTPKPPTTQFIAQDLLSNKNISMGANARRDLQNNVIYQPLVNLMGEIGQNFKYYIIVLKTGHRACVKGTNHYSNHHFGYGVDIGIVNGQRTTPSSSATRTMSEWIINYQGSNKPDELGQPFFSGVKNGIRTFTKAHLDHIHIGFDYPNKPGSCP